MASAGNDFGGAAQEEGMVDVDTDSGCSSEEEELDEFSKEDLQCMKIATYVVNEKLSNVATTNLLDLLRGLGHKVN